MRGLFSPYGTFCRLLLSSLFLLVTVTHSHATAVIKACGHHDYAPWNWQSGGEITGACAEVVRELFKQLGVETDLTYRGTWKRCQSLIREGEVDVNICSFINEERLGYSRFIMTPMGFNENAVFVHRDNTFSFSDWHDLARRKAAMVIGVSIGQKFDDFLMQHTDVERVSTFFQSFHMLARKRVDFIPVGRYSGRAMRDAFGLDELITDLPAPLLSGKLYISMSNKSKYLDLLPRIEELMQEEGYAEWLEQLLEKYTAIYAAEYRKLHPEDSFKSE